MKLQSQLLKNKTLVWGGGSCLRLICPYLRRIGRDADFIFSDVGKPRTISDLLANPIHDLVKAAEQCDAYVVCIGGSHGLRRSELSIYLENTFSLKPLQLIHPTAFICETVEVPASIIVMPNAVINSYADIKRDCMINTSAVIEHECRLGRGVHIMGSAVITGRVTVEDYATIGSNATVLPDLNIGAQSFVGAGAVVTKSVDPFSTVIGAPAKPMRRLMH